MVVLNPYNLDKLSDSSSKMNIQKPGVGQKPIYKPLAWTELRLQKSNPLPYLSGEQILYTR